MTKNKIKIIDSCKLKTLSIDVTEKINSKYLLEFLQTNILNNDLLFLPNTEFYYSFVESNMSYEVIIFDKPESLKTEFVLEPFVLLGYYEDNSNDAITIDLFYNENYFVVYQNKKLILFKQINNVNQEDIVLYLLQTYKIDIDNIIKIDSEILQNVKKSYVQNKNFKTSYQLNLLFVDKSFRRLQVFTLITTLLFAYLLYSNLNGNQIIVKSSKELVSLENRYNNLLQIYNKNSKKPVYSMVKFFRYIKLNKIVVDTVIYKNKKIKTILIHKNKKILLDTVTKYGQSVEIKSIEYDKKMNNYKLEILIEL
jgi:hypothetical protein